MFESIVDQVFRKQNVSVKRTNNSDRAAKHKCRIKTKLKLLYIKKKTIESFRVVPSYTFKVFSVNTWQQDHIFPASRLYLFHAPVCSCSPRSALLFLPHFLVLLLTPVSPHVEFCQDGEPSRCQLLTKLSSRLICLPHS